MPWSRVCISDSQMHSHGLLPTQSSDKRTEQRSLVVTVSAGIRMYGSRGQAPAYEGNGSGRTQDPTTATVNPVGHEGIDNKRNDACPSCRRRWSAFSKGPLPQMARRCRSIAVMREKSGMGRGARLHDVTLR